MSNILDRDISTISDDFCFYDEIRNSNILVTGSSGLIGSILVKSLVKINEDNNLNINIIAHARNKNKIESIFGINKTVKFIFSDIQSIDIEEKLDYIFHCAAPTSSKFYVENPVETIDTILNGTKNVLELSREKNIKSLVVLSSLESYGTILDDSVEINENSIGQINSIDVRSSYSLGKKMSECICHSYFKQYSVPVKIARLTQVFGAGISNEDNRVFAQFSRSVVNKENIVLHTSGASAKPYCYTTDTISALFYLIFKGSSGEAYNVANPKTYISIRDIAILLSKIFPESKLVQKIKENHNYAPDTKLKLNTSKIESLGWKAKVDIKDMFLNLIEYIKNK
jgi:nucleoside-diphosphate-sugar epimerase